MRSQTLSIIIILVATTLILTLGVIVGVKADGFDCSPTPTTLPTHARATHLAEPRTGACGRRRTRPGWGDPLGRRETRVERTATPKPAKKLPTVGRSLPVDQRATLPSPHRPNDSSSTAPDPRGLKRTHRHVA